jgi:hypothetical protein
MVAVASERMALKKLRDLIAEKVIDRVIIDICHSEGHVQFSFIPTRDIDHADPS